MLTCSESDHDLLCIFNYLIFRLPVPHSVNLTLSLWCNWSRYLKDRRLLRHMYQQIHTVHLAVLHIHA